RRRPGALAGRGRLPADRRGGRRRGGLRHPRGPRRAPRRGRGAAPHRRRGRLHRAAVPRPFRPGRGPGRADRRGGGGGGGRRPAPGRWGPGPDAGPAARLERPGRGDPLPAAGRRGRRRRRPGHSGPADPGHAVRTLAALAVIALIWASGLAAFAARVQQSTPQPEPARADGIVVLTGANSNERIAAAVDLLTQHKGRRVLVSGVNREVSREQLRAASGTVRRLYDCCVDLGFTAADTVGNARETAE